MKRRSKYNKLVLIAEFGQRVNLGEIKQENVVSIESQRRGFLSKASFSITPVKKGPEGSPAQNSYIT